eukprot:871614-Rhodomonas_salina.1
MPWLGNPQFTTGENLSAHRPSGSGQRRAKRPLYHQSRPLDSEAAAEMIFPCAFCQLIPGPGTITFARTLPGLVPRARAGNNLNLKFSLSPAQGDAMMMMNSKKSRRRQPYAHTVTQSKSYWPISASGSRCPRHSGSH